MNPSTFPRRILLAVTGLSPQVVTETLYALAVAQEEPFVPTEVHLITTREGSQRASLSLLSEDPGWFHRLCRDYGLSGIAFREDFIHVFDNAEGTLLEDIRSVEDNERAADFITEMVRCFTADGKTALHVSIAGGRKTMGYYLGYALSLYGRSQDRLSHVLVSEPFESSWDFFYPTPYSKVIGTRDNKLADTSQAEVTLANIPFVRLREGLPEELLTGRAPFSAVVTEAQKVLPPLSLQLDPSTRTVTAAGETVRLKPAEFAFYWMLVERVRSGQPGVHWSDRNLERELRTYYAHVVNPHSGTFERFEESGISKENFNSRKAHINKALRKVLGERRASPYLIQTLPALAGKGRCRPYGLALPREAVVILPASLPTRRSIPLESDNDGHPHA